jgi:hypothetical protein
MTVAMDALLLMLTPSEISELGQSRIDAAMQSSIAAYSIDFPREVVALTTVNSNLTVNLPLLWIEGFSYPSFVQYPVTEVTGVDNDVSITITFDISQWILNAGVYQLTLTHNLEYNDLMLEFIGSDGSNVIISRNQWVNLNTNQIAVRLGLEPDYRFAGKVIIRRLI